ncbi:MAG: hypothetical protein LBT59_13495 [Clostridiales bacterium]|nr:hypothetical protein [Clostridiales bacterium]
MKSLKFWLGLIAALAISFALSATALAEEKTLSVVPEVSADSPNQWKYDVSPSVLKNLRSIEVSMANAPTGGGMFLFLPDPWFQVMFTPGDGNGAATSYTIDAQTLSTEWIEANPGEWVLKDEGAGIAQLFDLIRSGDYSSLGLAYYSGGGLADLQLANFTLVYDEDSNVEPWTPGDPVDGQLELNPTVPDSKGDPTTQWFWDVDPEILRNLQGFSISMANPPSSGGMSIVLPEINPWDPVMFTPGDGNGAATEYAIDASSRSTEYVESSPGNWVPKEDYSSDATLFTQFFDLLHEGGYKTIGLTYYNNGGLDALQLTRFTLIYGNSGESEDPGDGEEPNESEDPGDGEEPNEGVEPGDGEEPGDGKEPGTGEEPSEGEEPGDGEEPGTGEEPGDGEEPSEGEEPGDGEEPGEGNEPDEGNEPGDGEDPGEAEDPGTGEESGEGEEPPTPPAGQTVVITPDVSGETGGQWYWDDSEDISGYVTEIRVQLTEATAGGAFIVLQGPGLWVQYMFTNGGGTEAGTFVITSDGVEPPSYESEDYAGLFETLRTKQVDQIGLGYYMPNVSALPVASITLVLGESPDSTGESPDLETPEEAVPPVAYYPYIPYVPYYIAPKQAVPAKEDPANPPKALTGPVAALPAVSKVLVNGADVSFATYNIADFNYFKLRDLAFALNGTGKQFEVIWEPEEKVIYLASGKPYVAAGGELAPVGATEKVAIAATATVYINGNKAQLTAYNIDGYNYFRLRDIGLAFNFAIGWIEAANTITIDTGAGYLEAEKTVTIKPNVSGTSGGQWYWDDSEDISKDVKEIVLELSGATKGGTFIVLQGPNDLWKQYMVTNGGGTEAGVFVITSKGVQPESYESEDYAGLFETLRTKQVDQIGLGYYMPSVSALPVSSLTLICDPEPVPGS